MTLTDQIKRHEDAVKLYDQEVEKLRAEKWDANFKRKNDERRPNESDEHWAKRKKRNKDRYERKDEAVDILVKKRDATKQLIDDLRAKRVEIKEAHADQKAKFQKGSTSIVVFDGKPVVEDLAYWLQLVRDKGLWHGVLVSGWRSPEESIRICIGMCGQQTCPDRCAGATTNHAKKTSPGPAGDVTDYVQCENALIEVQSGYFNDLPIDLVHMSRSGH